MNSYFLLEPLTSSQQTHPICLSHNKNYMCGQNPFNDVVIPNSMVSSKHCIFFITESGVKILDLKSNGGTYVNGEKIPPVTFKSLVTDDIIGFATDKTKNIDPQKFLVYRLLKMVLSRDSKENNGIKKSSKRKIDTDTSADEISDDDNHVSNNSSRRPSSYLKDNVAFHSSTPKLDNINEMKKNKKRKEDDNELNNTENKNNNQNKDSKTNAREKNDPSRNVKTYDKINIDKYDTEKANSDSVKIKGDKYKEEISTQEIQNKMDEREKIFFYELFKYSLAKMKESNKHHSNEFATEEISQQYSYDNYDQYDSIMTKLILQKAKSEISKNVNHENKNVDYFDVNLKPKSNKSYRIKPYNAPLTEYEIEMFLTEEEFEKKEYPCEYSFVILKHAMLPNNHDGNKYPVYNTIFAYTKKCLKTLLTPPPHHREYSTNTNTKQHALITYTIVTKQPFQPALHQNERLNLHSILLQNVCYLGNLVRMLRSIQFLQTSPLKNSVIKPKFDDKVFILPKISDKSHQLITGLRENDSIKRIILRIAAGLCGSDPKIFFLRVSSQIKLNIIGNIVTEVLYGTNKKKSQRILVCSPTNKLTDEVTNKLLDLNKELKHKHRMEIVRLGTTRVNHLETDVRLNKLLQNQSSYQDLLFSDAEKEKISILVEIKKYNCIKEQLYSNQQMSDDTPRGSHSKPKNLISRVSTLDEGTNNNLFNIKKKVLCEANVITSVSSSFFNKQMEMAFGIGKPDNIDVCIIEERFYGNGELETLLSLMLGVTKFVIIGNSYEPDDYVAKAQKNGNQTLFSRISGLFAGDSP
ncbi:Protein of unknown function, partial [Cotesia congregata]